MTAQPIILLTFTNHPGAYLPKIVAEQKAIKQALLDYADQNYLQVRDVEHASTEEVFYLVNRYHNRVAVWHYGGHADGQSLQLEREIGVVQAAAARGIAGLLGTQKQLKLAFLNGCATRGQVKTLLDQGVPVVLATRASVKDETAQRFAAQFYEALGSGSSIREAFQKARALLETEAKAPAIKAVEVNRDWLQRTSKEEKLPWGLYWRAENAGVLDWKLPTESPLTLDFGGDAVAGKKKSTINGILVNTTLKAIREGEFVRKLARQIIHERKTGNTGRKLSDSEKKDAIIRSYLAPISVHLRSLFSQKLSEKFDEERLRQLSAAYRKSIELFSFLMLSDIWDAELKKRKPLDLNDAERRQLQAFFELNEFTAPAFDYFQLADALLTITNRNDIRFYLEALNHYPEGWAGNETLAKANEHFNFMRTVLENDVPSRLIEPYCLASEQQLTSVLCEWYYLSQYKMAVIKNIEVRQIKNMPPVKYKHVMVPLDNNYNDVGHKDTSQDLDEPTDMESVLVYQDRLNHNLNLSPFVLDENALLREYNSKIFFFHHRTETELHYHWIENETNTLVIDRDHHGYVLEQFEKARRDILNEAAVEVKKGEVDGEEDILALM